MYILSRVRASVGDVLEIFTRGFDCKLLHFELYCQQVAMFDSDYHVLNRKRHDRLYVCADFKSYSIGRLLWHGGVDV